jgi:hypothetical protein
MAVLGSIALCWLGLNAILFAALITRKSRPRLKGRLFNWVIRTTVKEPGRPRGEHSHA